MSKRNKRNNDVPSEKESPDYQDYFNYEQERNSQAERWRNRKRKDRNQDDYEDCDN